MLDLKLVYRASFNIMKFKSRRRITSRKPPISLVLEMLEISTVNVGDGKFMCNSSHPNSFSSLNHIAYVNLRAAVSSLVLVNFFISF